MKEPIALIGYSGHAFVVAEAIEFLGYKLMGYFEREQHLQNPFELPYLGFEGNREQLNTVFAAGGKIFVGIGDNRLRKRIVDGVRAMGLQTIIVAHPESFVSSRASIGNGSFVAAGAKVNPLARVGEGAILNTGCIVEHECIVGDFTHIAPGAVLAGQVRVGDETFIGAGAVVKQGVKIGCNVIVGAGSVVLKDIPDSQIWFGNPAKIYTK